MKTVCMYVCVCVRESTCTHHFPGKIIFNKIKANSWIPGYDNNILVLISTQERTYPSHLTLKSCDSTKTCINFPLLQITTNLVA